MKEKKHVVESKILKNTVKVLRWTVWTMTCNDGIPALVNQMTVKPMMHSCNTYDQESL